MNRKELGGGEKEIEERNGGRGKKKKNPFSKPLH